MKKLGYNDLLSLFDNYWASQAYFLNEGDKPKNFTDKTYFFEVPGFSKEDINITVDKNNLTISSEKTQNTELGYELEPFKKTYWLPEQYDLNKLEATFNNGVLKIKIPIKQSETNIKRIEIK